MSSICLPCQRSACNRFARNASARQPLKEINLAHVEHVLNLLAMHLPGNRWKETSLASAMHALTLLAMHLVGSRWEEIRLASAEHVLELLATHLPC
jgi:hypothetical protein